MKRRARTLLASVVAFIASSANAQQLTLEQAVDEALKRNTTVTEAEAHVRAGRARAAEARSTRYPRLELSEQVTRSDNPVFVFGSLLEQARFGPENFDPRFLNDPDLLTNYRAVLTAHLNLFDGFRTSARVATGRNAANRAEYALDEVQQRIRADVIRRFFGVAIAKQRVEVARDAVHTAEADAVATRSRFEQGMLVESDALSADVQLADFRRQLVNAEGELSIARAGLAILLERPGGELIEVGPADHLDFVTSGELRKVPRPSRPHALARDDTPRSESILSTTAPDDLQQAVSRALANRGQIQIASLDMSDAQLRLRSEKGSRLPSVNLLGSAGASGESFGDRDSDTTGAIGISLTLFDGGREPRIAAARAEVDAARARDAEVRDSVTIEVVTAWHRLAVARESTRITQAAVTQAEAAGRIIRDRYEQGLNTITDHLRAQTGLISARFDLLAARYESVVAYADLLRATGELNDVQTFN